MQGIEEEAVKEWSQGLTGITGEQMKTGLEAWAEPWPPSLPEFRKACTGKKQNGFGLDYVPECYRESPQHDQSRLLSSTERDAARERSRGHIAAMREALKNPAEAGV